MENYINIENLSPHDVSVEIPVETKEKSHNYKALKTRLKKARRSNKLRERARQLRYIV